MSLYFSLREPGNEHTLRACKSTPLSCHAIPYTSLAVQSHESNISHPPQSRYSKRCKTYGTDPSMSLSGGTVHLIPESLDVVQAVTNDY
jgi:hypothetical protein